MRGLQPANECECRYLLTIVEDFGQLALKEVDIGLEAVPEPHLDRDELITTTLGFLARGVLCEKASVTSEKLLRERSGMDKNHSYAAPFKLEGKVRHITRSLRE